MADEANEKTEEATPRRKSKERDKGHISKSQDFTSSLVLICALGVLFSLGNNILDTIKSGLIRAFTNLKPETISEDDFVAIFMPYLNDYANITVLFFIILCAGAILILRLQTGALFAKEALKPNFKKLNPSTAFKNLIDKINFFKPRQMVELVKSLFKMAIVCFVGVKVILKRKEDLFGLIGANTDTGMMVMGSVLFELMATICIFLLFIGIVDKKYQDWEYQKSIKMSKQEVKDEFKNLEGDPKIKGKIRAFQMKMMQQKMMTKAKEADVVVVNPTHFAVGIKYNPAIHKAPIVVAKGVDFVAFKIREIAKNNNIPIVENKPLARSLYKLVDIDQMIPQELYVAVAEILQYVFSRRNR